jgi:hypothetical protein
MVSISGSQPVSAAIWQVVLLFGERVELSAMSAMEADVTRTLRSTAAEPVEVHIENLNLSRSRSPSYKAALRDFLHEKYLNRKINVAVAVMELALDFLLNSWRCDFSRNIDCVLWARSKRCCKSVVTA